MSGRPKLYQSKQPSGGKETAARLFYTQEAADFYDALMKQNLMKGSKVAESFHAYHEKHENKPPPPPAAETKKSSSKESQTDDKEFNKARDRPVRKSRLWGIVVGVAKACFRPVWKPLDRLSSMFILDRFAPTGILGIVGCAVTGDLWAVSKLQSSILRAVFRIVIGAVTGEFPKARPIKMYGAMLNGFSRKSRRWSKDDDLEILKSEIFYQKIPPRYEDSKEVYDFTYWYVREAATYPDPLNQRDNTARIKWKFRRRLLGWRTVLRSLVKTPKSYFGVGFGLLVLYCDRNMNKTNLRESLKDLQWSENFYEWNWNTDKKDPHYTLHQRYLDGSEDEEEKRRSEHCRQMSIPYQEWNRFKEEVEMNG